jgi:hypothetical protein
MARIIILPSSVEILIEHSWNFSYQNLWYRYLLSEEEIEICKDQLCRLFYSISAGEFSEKASNHFDLFCTRIVELKLRRERSRQKLLSLLEDIISELIDANRVANKCDIENKELMDFPICVLLQIT